METVYLSCCYSGSSCCSWNKAVKKSFKKKNKRKNPNHCLKKKKRLVGKVWRGFFGVGLPCWLVNNVFFLSQSGQLNEYTERKEMSADVVCMSLANVPPGEQRSRFLAVGLVDNTVRIISLDPSVSSCAVCAFSIGLKRWEWYSRGGLCLSKLSFRIQMDDQEWIACMAFLCWLGGRMALDPNL